MTWRATHHTPERVIHRSHHAEWEGARIWLQFMMKRTADVAASICLNATPEGCEFDHSVDGHRYQLSAGGRR